MGCVQRDVTREAVEGSIFLSKRSTDRKKLERTNFEKYTDLGCEEILVTNLKKKILGKNSKNIPNI